MNQDITTDYILRLYIPLSELGYVLFDFKHEYRKL